ncbi:MAG TPA: hypothetical protein VES88_07930 [Gemmatimonadaceae bacterium]|nr:hypothetical protein [Gemmatimonadaceae bacterium]
MTLPRIRSGLLRHTLDNQVLIYDSRDDRVHLLDPTTACVLELLEEGGWTSEGITAELAVRLSVAPNEAFLPLALEELRNADLLEPTEASPAALVDVPRRDLIRKLALTGAAAMLVPAIATLSATRAYGQASPGVGTVASCQPCTQDEQCADFAGDPTKGCNEFNICGQTGQAPLGGACGPGGAPNCCTGSCSGGTCI